QTAANFQGNNFTDVVLTTSVSVANSISWGDGIRQTFNPNATNSGLNVGAHTAEPSSPTDGDLFYDSTALSMKARINGAWVELGSGGASPLTTKGDLFTFDTGDQRLAVGADTFVLTADSAEATGIKWAAPAAASQTPWVSDIDADSFSLQDFHALEFTDIASDPAGTIAHINFNSSLLKFNVPTGDAFRWQVNNVDAMSLFNNNLSLLGIVEISSVTDITMSGTLSLGAGIIQFDDVNTTITQSSADLLYDVATGGTHSLRINNIVEYSFNATQADFNSNNIVGLNDLTLAGNIVFPDGIRQTFNPNATNAGLNVGTQSDPDPTSPVNGDIYYNTTNNKFRAYENSVWVDMIVAGGSGDVVG
ncbi:hypothetical protein LCGC14_3012050, partial [marine sediment metagenome]